MEEHMAFYTDYRSLPHNPTSTEQHVRRKEGFLPPAWVLLLVVSIVFGLFYLAVAAKFADNTAVLMRAVTPISPAIVIGEETRPTQAPIR